MALLDVVVQGVQGLMYDLSRHSWPTNVDLMDVMLLVARQTGVGEGLMKAVLVGVLVAWSVVFAWLFRRASRLRTRISAPVTA